MNFQQPTETGKPDYDPLVDSFELLMKLYPDEHPANLHGVMCVNNNNVVEAMKILQYYRNYREMSIQQLEHSASTYLPSTMMSTYVPQASTFPSMSTYKTQHGMSANEVPYPMSTNTDQLSASMYAYKTLPSIAAQTPTSTTAGQLPVALHEPERFMYKYEPELSRSLYQPNMSTSQHMFDQPSSMSSEEKQVYNTTCRPKTSAFPHDLYRFTPLSGPQLSCTSLSEPQCSLPVFDPQHSTTSSEVQHSSSVSDGSEESQPIITTFDTSTTSTDLNSTSTMESENLEPDYAVSTSSSDDDNREYIVLVPVDDQEMELTPSGLTPPAYRMTSVYRGKNGQFMKKP